MPGSDSRIFSFSNDFQNLRDLTSDDKKYITGLVLQCVFNHMASTTHHTNRFHSQTFRCQAGNLAKPHKFKHEFRVIPFCVSVTSHSDWLHVTFHRLRVRLSSGNNPQGRTSGQDNPTC
ncbi:hypothetical protein AMECASPLE_012647 [Ameca splendens]|uniref:Uncharacterized protein n=1 Tax=Ameca splendens TaxID=208324 RepID=A0ABV0YZ28_9TELE